MKTPSEPDWYRTVRDVEQKLATYADHGFPSQWEYLPALASEKGLTLLTIQRQIAAKLFLETTYPKLLPDLDANTGYTIVALLKKIWGVDKKTADANAKNVIRGLVDRRSLEAVYDALEENPGRRNARSAARTMERAFEKEVLAYALNLPGFLGLKRIDEVINKPAAKPLWPDFAVRQGDLTLAVEAKRIGRKTSDRDIAMLLARLTYFERFFSEACVVVPLSESDVIPRIMRLDKETSQGGFSCYVLPT